jgi:DNA-binding Lrp family transcriptional regulator
MVGSFVRLIVARRQPRHMHRGSQIGAYRWVDIYPAGCRVRVGHLTAEWHAMRGWLPGAAATAILYDGQERGRWGMDGADGNGRSSGGSPPINLSLLDQRLLAELQDGLPLAVAPFRELAARLGSGERDVIARVAALRDAGILRHISAIFDAEALGYSTCLVAMRVPEARLPVAVEAVNAHPGVSHNYRRAHEFNLWFTIAVPPGSDVEAHVRALHGLARAESARPLPALRRFKIGVSLDVTGERTMDHRSAPRHTGGLRERDAARALTERDVDVIRAVQGDLPLRAHPFADAARAIGMTEDALVHALHDLRRRGALRRIAGILRHRDAGFGANGMAVWDVPDARTCAVGEAMARYTAISHCYERPRYDDWRYNLFTMIHARSTPECDAFVAQLARAQALDDHAVLYSTEEYKKVRPVYFTPEIGEWERRFLLGAAR